MHTDLGIFQIIGNVLAFSEALVILLVAGVLTQITANVSRGKVKWPEGMFFFYGATAYFLFKLSFFLFDFFGLSPQLAAPRLFSNGLLFAAGLLMVLGCRTLARFSGGANG